MIRIGTLDAPARSKSYPEGRFQGSVDFLIESDPTTAPAPQAYVVYQNPGWVLPVHFHMQDQFQVVVDGDGALGAHALTPGTIHFATREAGYGPIVAGPQGLTYMTFREVNDLEIRYLPEELSQMNRGLRKKQFTVHPVPSAESVQELYRDTTSGVAAWRLSMAPAEKQVCPATSGSGRFHIVLQGAIRYGDRRLQRLSCLYASADEPALGFTAEGMGAVVIIIQYPSDSTLPTADLIASARS